MKRICIVGISGKLGRYMAAHALARGWQVQGVCRPKSVCKLADLADRITLFPGHTDDAAVVAAAVKGCDGVLCVLVPWGSKATPHTQPRRYWPTLNPARGWSFPAAGTSAWTGKTAIRAACASKWR